MMKKFKLKGLKLTSPRKDRKSDDHPQSPTSIESQDDGPSYSTADEKPNSESAVTKRSSLFSTLRRKLTSGKRNDGKQSHSWHDCGPSSSGMSGTSTLPSARTVSSWRAAPRRISKPLRPAVSEERLSSSDDYFVKSRFSRKDPPLKDLDFPFVKQDNSSRSDDESEKEESRPNDQDNKVLLPMDAAEYGHASAPSSNEQSAIIPTSSSSDSETGTSLAQSCAEGTPTATATASAASTDACRSSQQEHKLCCVNNDQDRVQSMQLFYDRIRLNAKPWSLTDELFRLSKYGWYWGPITRIEAEEKLANLPDGAFLVRDSSDERYLLSLSFRSYGRTLHTRIEHCNGVFSFYAQPECEGYKSVVSLITHSMSDSQTGVFCYSRARTPGAPSFPVRLTKPVSRFTHVRSLQYLCRFVIRQNTRYDHIQKLPLPTSIKGWLEENQY